MLARGGRRKLSGDGTEKRERENEISPKDKKWKKPKRKKYNISKLIKKKY